MRDLTQGSIVRHLLAMAAFIAAGLIVQTLYVLVDLYFVARLGDAAIAGVASAATASYVVIAASQLVSVGPLALIAQAIGRRDARDAQLVFEQALLLSLLLAGLTLLLGYGVGLAAIANLGADAPTGAAAAAYLAAFLPSLALMFPIGVIGSALRAAGVMAAPMIIQALSVALNVVLAPVLIAGWGSGMPLGVAGAGLASSIASLAGTGAMLLMFNRVQPGLRLGATWVPQLAEWRRIIIIGVPAAGEFLMMFLIGASVYWIIRDFGAAAQAGFGLASRVMQAVFLPAMAVAFAAAPIAGQNFGAGRADRVRATFAAAAMIGSGIMLALTLLCQLRPALLLVPFTDEPAVIAIAAGYLRISSWNFVAIGLVFAASGMFQALGDTRPALVSSAGRALTFIVPALLLAQVPGVTIETFWQLSVASIGLQAITSLWLLRRELRGKLAGLQPAAA